MQIILTFLSFPRSRRPFRRGLFSRRRPRSRSFRSWSWLRSWPWWSPLLPRRRVGSARVVVARLVLVRATSASRLVVVVSRTWAARMFSVTAASVRWRVVMSIWRTALVFRRAVPRWGRRRGRFGFLRLASDFVYGHLFFACCWDYNCYCRVIYLLVFVFYLGFSNF